METALNLAGARRVDAHAARTLGANFEMERPLLNRDLTVWELPLRKVHPGGCHHRAWVRDLGAVHREGGRNGPTSCPPPPQELGQRPSGR